MSDVLTKQAVARSQLLTALKLFFENDDIVSIYTLASNAWEIIDSLCDSQNVESLSNQTRDHIGSDKDLKKDFVNSPARNFFKHADRDPEDLLEDFTELKCDGLLYLAVEDYMRLHGTSPIEFQVFQLWYLSIYIEKVAAGELTKILEPSEQIFPNIRNLNREGQKELWRKTLEKAKQDPEVLHDPRTEV